MDAGQGDKAVADLQKRSAPTMPTVKPLARWARHTHRKAIRARAVAQFEKAIALDPQSDNRGKWDSLLKVNRYWLLIQQGDAALKANNPTQAERYYQQARNIDNTDSYAVLGLGDAAAARKDNAAAERYYRQALRMDSGNSNAVRGLANIYRAQSPEKASQFIQSLSASQRRSIDDIERSLTNEQLSAEAEQLENQGKYAQAAEIQRRRLALSPGDVWITYRLSRDLYSAGQRSQADTLMRQLASQKPTDPDQVYANGLYLSGNDQDRAALAHLDTLPREPVERQHPGAGRPSAKQPGAGNRQPPARQRQRAGGGKPSSPAAASTRIDLTLADWATAAWRSGLGENDLQRRPAA